MSVEFAPKEYRKYELDWDEARLYCFSLRIDGKVGWRLPTALELMDDRVDELIYDTDQSNWFWTAECSTDRAEQVDLYDFETMSFGKTNRSSVWVCPVRDLKDD